MGDLYTQRLYIYRYEKMLLGSRMNLNPTRTIWFQQPKEPHQSPTSSYNGLLRRTASTVVFRSPLRCQGSAWCIIPLGRDLRSERIEPHSSRNNYKHENIRPWEEAIEAGRTQTPLRAVHSLPTHFAKHLHTIRFI